MDGLYFPYDVLINILRRLRPRILARCRRVCRVWRATIDDNLLGPPHFPRCGFHGFFLNKTGYNSDCSFFAPRKAASNRFVCLDEATILHSCNGLLLAEDNIRGWFLVYNPATTRYARLPSPPGGFGMPAMSLAFDPAVSLEYNVFLLHGDALARPVHRSREKGDEEPKKKVVPLVVYSSRTECWENREFLPGRCAPGHLYDMVATPCTCYDDGMVWSSEYWHGSFYMHCHHGVLMILRRSKGTYDMITLPGETSQNCIYKLPTISLLASYERGIHYATMRDLHLKLWTLTESTDGQLGWTLAHEASLKPHCHMIESRRIQPKVTWVMEEEEEKGAGTDGSKYSWNSDEDNFIDAMEGATQLEPRGWGHEYRVVGFHPHKNAIILVLASVVVVYHVDTSRIQYLGDWYELIKDPAQQACNTDDSFTYRPCYKDLLRTGKLSDIPS